MRWYGIGNSRNHRCIVETYCCNNLLFNKTTKKFTIKRNDKQNSTIKSLGPKKINIAKKPLTDKIDTI